ncbi:hypothetical protein [Pseudomonas sp.]|jgi:hypothetical protein|uniref:hypothetical protein n=1 Tax=Pseudomonas sp. TaxID=306 RepID=UPI003FD77B5D
MDAANKPRTTRDALTIELMGDIGRLDDKIKALPDGLKEALSPALDTIGFLRDEFAKLHTEVRLMPKAIASVQEGAVEQIEKSARAVSTTSGDQMIERFLAAIKSETKSVTSKALNEVMDETAQAVTSSISQLRSAASHLNHEAQWVKGRNAFAWRLGAIAAGLSALTVSIVFVGLLLVIKPSTLLSATAYEQQQLGAALEQAWNKLDEPTRSRIQGAMDAATKK